jgi:hypothetical protein
MRASSKNAPEQTRNYRIWAISPRGPEGGLPAEADFATHVSKKLTGHAVNGTTIDVSPPAVTKASSTHGAFFVEYRATLAVTSASGRFDVVVGGITQTLRLDRANIDQFTLRRPRT